MSVIWLIRARLLIWLPVALRHGGWPSAGKVCAALFYSVLEITVV